jgi:hypothetical protein
LLSYENLDRIADAYNPILAAVWLLLVCRTFLFRGWRAGLIQTGLGVGTLLIAYGLMWLDNAFGFWPALGLDYSTHTAVAFALGASIFAIARPCRLAVAVTLAAYVLLMLYQQYHSVGDIVSTLLVLAVPVCALAYALQAAADNSSRPKSLGGSDQLLR